MANGRKWIAKVASSFTLLLLHTQASKTNRNCDFSFFLTRTSSHYLWNISSSVSFFSFSFIVSSIPSLVRFINHQNQKIAQEQRRKTPPFRKKETVSISEKAMNGKASISKELNAKHTKVLPFCRFSFSYLIVCASA